jgi:hypothetical protein
MKIGALKIILISILPMLSMCLYADCREISFKENYLKYFQKDEVFFIKGIALDVFEYGRTIKVIEDLKGNFTGESSIFVWGAGNPPGGKGCMSIERCDVITQYQKNDTLIMLVGPVAIKNCFETFGDYTTIPCAYSILKFSNGFVSGYIHPWELSWEEITMSWEELQELLMQSSY